MPTPGKPVLLTVLAVVFVVVGFVLLDPFGRAPGPGPGGAPGSEAVQPPAAIRAAEAAPKPSGGG